MDSARFQRVQEVFEAALRSSPGEARDRVLLTECGNDAELLREVRSLLAAEQAESQTPRPEKPAADTLRTRRYGPFLAERLLGHGGMGAVWLARRTEGGFEQHVALKLVAGHLAGDFFAERFRAERQILAGLEHPNIARLIDGGVAEDGTSWLAMEYVDGQELDAYCEARKLGVRERLDLFRQVCAAVSHAHRNLVVHRDLKPANILVTAEGQPKLLDFGTAKLLSPGAEATMTGYAMFTPRYASPEQLRGDMVTTASDVYSLGMVLYELLTGLPPWGKQRTTLEELRRGVEEQEPRRPSEACPARRAELQGDLDTIVGKALHWDPLQRYQSVDQLSDDLRRYLIGATVSARPSTFGYRASKFIRRYRVGVAAGVLSVALLTGATVVSIHQARLAHEEADKARRVSAFVKKTLLSTTPNWFGTNSKSASVTDLLDGAARRVSQDLGSEPASEADMRLTLGRAYSMLGQHAKAQEQEERALALAKRIGAEAQVAEIQSFLGEAAYLRGDPKLAVELMRESRKYALRMGEKANWEYRMILANNLAVALSGLSQDIEEPRKLMGEVTELLKQHAQEGDTRIAMAVAAGSMIAAMRGDLEMAERLARQSLAINQRQSVVPLESYVGHANLGTALATQGRLEEALEEQTKAYDILIKGLGAEHLHTMTVRSDRARTIARLGRGEEAETELRETLTIWQRIRAKDHPDSSATMTSLGFALQVQGRLREAEEWLRWSLGIQRKAFRLKDRRLSDTTGTLGMVLLEKTEFAEAGQLLEESAKIYNMLYPPQHPYVVRARERLEQWRTASAAAEPPR